MQRFEIRMEPSPTEPLYYFVLVSKNGDVFARSVMYPTKQAVENRINLIKDNASTAKVVDHTTAEAH
ncbi:YegP family protein [Vibrio porteresiae]|uniref:YegP family protein n=1 Tax=Vibrio porteresiae DSM 19223 TaxID=1123496 RepID=A0ABZ0QHX4_9VIBR|nr:YegP family protein [Vibrio porteresiae]WPC75061.1 YegP family protein [Vibrio porteresiae DSM 19223]